MKNCRKCYNIFKDRVGRFLVIVSILMKQIIKIIGNFLFALIVLAILYVAIKSLARPFSSPAASDLVATDYPLFSVTLTRIDASETPYLAPPLVIPTQSSPTISPLTPHPPPDWPTDEPWPPLTSTPMPRDPTPTVAYVATPALRLLDGSVPSEGLQSLWYPESLGKNGQFRLVRVLIDAKGNRKEKVENAVNLSQGRATDPSIQQLFELNVSPDGKWVEYALSEMGSGIDIVDTLTGKKIQPLPTSMSLGIFYHWIPNRAAFLAGVWMSDEGHEALVDVDKHILEKIDFSENKVGIEPRVQDLAISPDGLRMADIIMYPPTYQKTSQYVTEVGIQNSKFLSNREVVCSITDGMPGGYNGLRWSPKNDELIWIQGLEVPGKNDWDDWLWTYNLKTGLCQKIAHLGMNQSEGLFIPGGFSAEWSPTGDKIVYQINDPSFGYKLVLLDRLSGQAIDLIGPTHEIITNVKFSPDGSLITYSIFKDDHGEIWAISLDGKDNFPIAGPTSAHAPYQWLK
jgi:hypothetical protein